MSEEKILREEYEIDSAEKFYVRAHVILRQIFYAYKDAELDGKADHSILKTLVDSIIYNALVAEEKIKEISENVPTEVPPIHGKEKYYTEQMLKGVNDFYEKIRKEAHDRVKYKKLKRPVNNWRQKSERVKK